MRVTYCLSLVFVLALALAPAAHADEASDRFHEAYVQEVIEGKVADAAKVYLSLMEDPKVDARLRLEARFRFGVCAVLLGRADEGRSHLQAIVTDGTTPEALRTRAAAYLESVAAIEVGSELDKKLRALVFDLGRVPAGNQLPPVYRDFEIIGTAAVPFLKKLLQHNDQRIRRHAFRILARLDAPGLGQLWNPDVNAYPTYDTVKYLGRHEDELAVFEKRVREMGKPAWNTVRYFQGTMPFTKPFILDFANTGLAPSTAVAWLGYKLEQPEFDQLLTWMRGDETKLSDAALNWLLTHGNAKPQADEALYEEVFGRLMNRLQASENGIQGKALDGFQAYSDRMSTDRVFQLLERVIQDVETHDGKFDDRKAATLLFQQLTESIDSKTLSGPEGVRYGDLLLRWYAMYPEIPAGATQVARGTRTLDGYLARQFRNALAAMPLDDAQAFVRKIFAVPGRANNQYWYQVLPDARKADGVRVATAAILAAPQGLRHNLFSTVKQAPPPQTPGWAALRKQQDESHREILGTLTAGEIPGFFQNYSQVMRQRPSEDVREQLHRLILIGRELEEPRRRALLEYLFGGTYEYFIKVVAPMAVAHWNEYQPFEQQFLLDTALGRRQGRISDANLRERMADAAAKVIQPNLDKIESSQLLMTLKSDRERYPLESWVPLLDRNALQRLLTRGWKIQEPEADAVAAKMTADATQITPAVLKFVSQWCSEEVSQRIFDAEITSTDAKRRRQGLLELGHEGEPASLKALETAVALELAEEPLNLSYIRMSGEYLLKRRPSEKLFPVARTLLRSEERYDILAGIRMADSLGREDLVQDLKPHLRSMDNQIRVGARKAVAAIRAISDLAAEVEAGGK